MHAVSVREIVDITDGKLICGNYDEEITKLSLDSRTIEEGDIFIAIKGHRFNGHSFVKDVINKGVRGVIVEDIYELPEKLPRIVVKVRDTIKVLGDIARIYRNRFKGPLIAITGTVGKTTTKEFIVSVLCEKLSVHKTEGTLNNQIGVPITLWGLEPRHEVCVLELGMSGLGEISYLSGISQPDVGVITNIGPAHLEYLGSIDNIINAKAELLENLGKSGLVVLNRDCNYFPELQKRNKSRLVTIGKHHGSDFQAIDIVLDRDKSIRFKVLAKPFNDILEINIPVVGMHNIYPALTGIAIGYGLGLTPSEMINGLMKIKLPKMRLELKEIAGIRVLDDCYNANPISMAGALETLNMLGGIGKKIFVCSDMLELGQNTPMYHKELGKKVIENKVDRLITIGEFSNFVSSAVIEYGMPSDYVQHCKDNIDAVTVLAKWLIPGDTVLVKGSRAMHMEDIVKGIEEYYSTLEKLIV